MLVQEGRLGSYIESGIVIVFGQALPRPLRCGSEQEQLGGNVVNLAGQDLAGLPNLIRLPGGGIELGLVVLAQNGTSGVRDGDCLSCPSGGQCLHQVVDGVGGGLRTQHQKNPCIQHMYGLII